VRSDIREALRSFTTEPGFSLVVVVTLALAIGINSAIFSVLNAVLLRPLDYADPGRLVVVWESNQAAGQPQSETSGATYLDHAQADLRRPARHCIRDNNVDADCREQRRAERETDEERHVEAWLRDRRRQQSLRSARLWRSASGPAPAW
jgi:hypothetical protein